MQVAGTASCSLPGVIQELGPDGFFCFVVKLLVAGWEEQAAGHQEGGLSSRYKKKTVFCFASFQ